MRLFDEIPNIELPNLSISESLMTGYRSRTIENCRLSDLTIAFACDFTTAGERLTKASAKNNYLAIDKETNFEDACYKIYRKLEFAERNRLNIAGNGLYTLIKYGINQEIANTYIYKVLNALSQHCKIESVRSGGQSGIDTAGLVAALKLNIPTIGLYPKYYVKRNLQNVDFKSNKEDIIKELYQMRDLLQ